MPGIVSGAVFAFATSLDEVVLTLFEAGELLPDTPLSGEWTPDESEVDLDSVRQAINDAREEAIIRQQGREAAEAED